MSKGFRERILEVFENGAALANSGSQTSLLPASAKGSYIEAGSLEVGSVIAFEFSGRVSNIVTTPGWLQLALRLGSVDVFLSGQMALNAVAKTDVHWSLRGELVCRAIGLSTTTTLFPKGCRWESHSVIGAAAPTAGGAGVHLLPFNAAPAVGSGFDFSASQLIDLMAQWQTANTGNSIQLHAGHVDVYSRT